MQKFLIILLSLMILGCGDIRKQYHTVISPEEMQRVKVYCTTFLGVPVACYLRVDTQITITIKDIVIEVRDRIVVEEKIVEIEVEKIVTEIHTIFKEKQVDLETIVAEAVRRVKASVPTTHLTDANVGEVVREVAASVIEDAPQVVEDTPYVDTPIENPTPQNTPRATPQDGGYVVYSHLVNGRMQSGVIHSDYVVIQDGMITFTGQDGEIDPGDTSREYVEVETGLSYEQASKRAPEILTE